jgi:hypothetical protein
MPAPYQRGDSKVTAHLVEEPAIEERDGQPKIAASEEDVLEKRDTFYNVETLTANDLNQS